MLSSIYLNNIPSLLKIIFYQLAVLLAFNSSLNMHCRRQERLKWDCLRLLENSVSFQFSVPLIYNYNKFLHPRKQPTRASKSAHQLHSCLFYLLYEINVKNLKTVYRLGKTIPIASNAMTRVTYHIRLYCHDHCHIPCENHLF